MKMIKKNIRPFSIVILLGLLIGSLSWEVVELIIARSGLDLNLGTGPIGFDIGVLSLYVEFNPGSILGCIGGAIYFRWI